MEQKIKRRFNRIRLHNPEEVTLFFNFKDGTKHKGFVWDFSRFGLGLILDEEYPITKNSILYECELSAYGQIRTLGEAEIVRIEKKDKKLFLGLSLHKEFVDMDMLSERRTIHIQADEINNLGLNLRNGTIIKDEFKLFTASFVFGLSVFKKHLDELDAKFAKEPSSLKHTLFDSVMQGIGKELWVFLEQEIEKLKILVKNYSKSENEKHGFFLRRAMWNFILESEFIKRTNLKPRGYAGDSDMMEMLYKMEFSGNSSFGKIFHKHPVDTKAAWAVRNRRKLIVGEINKSISAFDNSKDFKLLSIACGPAWELQDFFSESPNNYIEAVLLDQDTEALGQAKNRIESIPTKVPFKVTYLKESVRTILRSSNPEITFGKYNFIYSMGLYDYLTDSVAKVLTEKLYSMLAIGGTLIIGNYHIENETRIYMEYIMDWVLFYRDEESLMELTSDFKGKFSVEIGFDNSGTQMFLKIIKISN